VSASPAAAPPRRAAPGRRRVALRVDGVVQGVGFRPFVHRLAGELGLAGFVRNDARGVVAEVEGDAGAVTSFLGRLAAEAPPLACVDAVHARDLEPAGATGFVIAASAGGSPDALVAPDGATCDACLAELFDPADRRFRYPFLSCTNCGPRFTIVRGVPYDRPRTTMAAFAMCERCRAEYDDPADRRFHAQPNACPACGPRARLVDAAGRDAGSPGARDAVHAAALALAGGRIVAVKGIGGYHLACRADDEAAVAALRARKRREEKPFALLAPDLDAARELVRLTAADARALRSVQRPIVLARRRAGAPVAAAVAPRSAELGVMLPYAPLHHLLATDAAAPLVLTSGNVSDEPIAFRDDDARERLGAIADALLVHDRPIHTRTDDSVVRVVRGRTVALRRSRGYVPAGLALPVPAARPVLACGAELKSTFCLARGRRAWLSHHVGDLTDPETLRSFEEGVAHLARLFAVAPEVVAHDLHPQYLSTAFAEALEGVELVGVQHHHAHLAACLAEHGEEGPAVGAIFDGTGHGADGTAWGGELLAGGLGGFARAGRLWPVRLPGGDRAAREPWRMACAWLQEALGREPDVPPALAGRIGERRWRAVAALARGEVAAPVTTSAGRLFDAVAALCGGPLHVAYEGQAAIELEALADPFERGAYELPLVERPAGAPPGGELVLDPRPTVLAAAADVAAGVAPGVVSARFHRGLAAAAARACAAVAADRGLGTAVLSGGVFQNRLLLEAAAAGLERAGLRVLLPERVPANDGGISFGQAAIAARATAGG
jgi:hydrogenase maturation protein HypF